MGNLIKPIKTIPKVSLTDDFLLTYVDNDFGNVVVNEDGNISILDTIKLKRISELNMERDKIIKQINGDI